MFEPDSAWMAYFVKDGVVVEQKDAHFFVWAVRYASGIGRN